MHNPPNQNRNIDGRKEKNIKAQAIEQMKERRRKLHTHAETHQKSNSEHSKQHGIFF